MPDQAERLRQLAGVATAREGERFSGAGVASARVEAEPESRGRAAIRN